MIFRRSIFTLIMIGGFIFTNHYSFGQCKAKNIMKACKPNIEKPYKYDSFAYSEFVFDGKPKTVEVQFTAFKGLSYKVVFCANGFEAPLKMNIYDKNLHIKQNRHKVFDNDMGIDNNFWSFVPPKSGNYYIDYDVPALPAGKTENGCVIMLISYYDNPTAK